jgi:predicted 3-demethylubiquinone-9 3-methyltransferase (glyoxalase superfamily)
MAFDKYVRSPAYGRCNDKYGVSRQVMYDNRETSTEHAMIPSLMYTGAMAGKAEEAMNMYTKLFPDSSIDFLWRYEAGGVDKEGTINHGEFKLHGQQFIAMDSAMEHKFSFTEGVSLMVSCKDQTEVDRYRDALIADGGQESQCGWCKDKYGVSRQVAPVQLSQALFQADKIKADHAMQAMMKMKKIVIAELDL